MAQQSADVDQLRIEFTQFETSTTTEGDDVEVTWGDFTRFLKSEGFLRARSKKEVGLLLPVLFKPGAKRKTLDDIQCVTMGALDYDELTPEQAKRVLTCLRREKLAAFLYSTWGHPAVAPKRFKFRVLIPFSRAVETAEWEYFWPLLNGLLGGLSDPACADFTHGYFVPAVPEGASLEHTFMFSMPEGEQALDVDHLLSSIDTLSVSDLADVSSSSQEPIDRDRVKKFAKRMSRSSVEYRAWMGDLLLKVLQGEPFAEKGQRDNTVYKLAQDLGEAFPEAAADSLAVLFSTSLSNMGPDCPSVEDVRDKVQRAQRQVLEKRLREKKKELIKGKQLRERAGAKEYTKEWIEQFCERTGNGSTFELFGERLILQKGNRFFVFFNGNYHPFTERELSNACRDLLKPAADLLDVSLYNVNEKGFSTPKSPPQLVHDYGVVAHHEEQRMYAQATFYEESTHTIVEAPCPLRALEPEEIPEVDEWIEVVTGSPEVAEALRDWMAVAPDLTRALAMLVFVGVTGVGKTAFANCLARLWTTGDAVKMEHAFASFNTEIKRCPILLADETLPVDFRGRVPTDKIRSLISSNSHAINPKNRDIINLRGFFRLVAAINGNDKLDFGQAHSREDLEAIKRRTLIIPVNPKAQALFDYGLFYYEDGIARHALWLQQNREVQESRFGVEATKVTHVLDLIRDSTTENVLEWVLWFLKQRKLEEEHNLPAFVLGEHVYLNADNLHIYWESCFNGKEQRRPNKAKLRESVAVLRDEEEIRVRLSSGERRRYSRISNDTLFRYIAREGQDLEYFRLQLQCYTLELYENSYVKLPTKHRRVSSHQKDRRRFAERRLEALREITPEGEDDEEEEADEEQFESRVVPLDPLREVE